MHSARLVFTLVALGLVGAACAEQASDGAGREEARLQDASQGLCDAQVLVSRGDVVEAAQVFEGETHAYLHELADLLQGVDREAAATLLRVKQRFEEVVATPERADPEAAAALIPELQRALIEAAEAAGLPRPLCREGAT